MRNLAGSPNQGLSGPENVGALLKFTSSLRCSGQGPFLQQICKKGTSCKRRRKPNKGSGLPFWKGNPEPQLELPSSNYSQTRPAPNHRTPLTRGFISRSSWEGTPRRDPNPSKAPQSQQGPGAPNSPQQVLYVYIYKMHTHTCVYIYMCQA